MMIEYLDTIIASRAVTGSWGTVYFAGLAKTATNSCCVGLLYQILLKLCLLFLQEWATGDNTRVRALGEIEEKQCHESRTKEQHRHSRTDIPNSLEHEYKVRNQYSNDAQVDIQVGTHISKWPHNAAKRQKPIPPWPSLIQPGHNLQSILLQYYTKYSNVPMQNTKPRYNHKINKILYIVILMAILHGILFYLDILNYLSLENVVSVILGFLILIIVQMRFISYYFQDQMTELGLDQVGIVQDFIKNKVFGEININYIAKKQKKKYYHHTKDERDKLFDDDNSETFSCVMAVLRSKSEINNNDRHKLTKEKWEIFIAKIGQFEAFLASISKSFKQKGVTYNKKFNSKASLFKDEDYQKWGVLFSPNVPVESQISEPNKNPSWLQLKSMVQQKFAINDSLSKQMSTLIVNQFNGFAVEMRALMREATAGLQISENEDISTRKSYREIIDKIKTTNQKIDNLIKKFNQKNKGSENMELIVNTEYDIRNLRQQLDDLEVRKTYAKDMFYKHAQTDYILCSKIGASLEDSGIKKFNNKIQNYIVTLYGKLDNLMQRKKQIKQFHNMGPEQQLLNMKNIYTNNIKQAKQNLKQFQKRFDQFRLFVTEMISAIDDQIKCCKNINNTIKDYDMDWKLKCAQFRFSQEAAIGEKVDDKMFLEMIRSMNEKQLEVLEKFLKILKNQEEVIDIKMKQKSNFKNLSQNYEFEMKNKIPSFLPVAIQCLTQGSEMILKEVEEKKDLFEKKFSKTELYNTQPIQKMNEYKDQIFKLEKQQFQSEENEKKDEKQLDRQSLKFANRIIDVFAAEWRNSDFFHGILREEIELSLNAKRPPFLNYMTVKYIKVHEKSNETIKSLNVLGDNVFICHFQVLVHFDGKIAVHIQTSIKHNKMPINIKLLITHFKCPVRICFTPFSLGKSNVCMMETPQLSLEYSAKLGNFELTKIPFLSLIIKLYIVIKLRKKFLFPKKATIKVPLAVKNALQQAIKQQVNFEKLMEKKKKSD